MQEQKLDTENFPCHLILLLDVFIAFKNFCFNLDIYLLEFSQ